RDAFLGPVTSSWARDAFLGPHASCVRSLCGSDRSILLCMVFRRRGISKQRPCNRNLGTFNFQPSTLSRLQLTPMVPVLFQEPICFFGPFTAGRIIGENGLLLLRPCLFDRSDQPPLRFDFVPSREQRRITQHHVQQQRFVRRQRLELETVAVAEI